MAAQVRMVSKTVFANDRITVFREGGPEEGERGIPATVGDRFTTDLEHARELNTLGFAEAWNPDDLDGEPDALEPHHQVSETTLRADRKARAAAAAADRSAESSVQS